MDDDPDDDFDYRPDTGIFVHTSGDVRTVRFENGDSLGVTANHPIYSATYRDWRLAGELEPGERVLTKNGYTVVASKEKLEGERTVYTLEVRGLHNFLVGAVVGVVVHNSCIFSNILGGETAYWRKTHPLGTLDENYVDELVEMIENGDIDYIFSDPIVTTTYQGETYLIDGHHRIEAVARANYQGNIPYSDVAPGSLSSYTRYNNIQEVLDDAF